MENQDAEILQNAKEIARMRFRHSDLSQKPVKELIRLSILYEAKRLGYGTETSVSYSKSEDIGPGRKTSAARNQPIDPAFVLRNSINLPSLPNIFGRLVEIMSDPLSSAKDFAQVIMEDPGLSARLLRIVNSAYYGFRSMISTISQAVTIIGTNDLYALCMGTSVMTMFKEMPVKLVDMESFWKHSLSCGIIARFMAKQQKVKNPERFFVAGILHDLGRLIIYNYLPIQAETAIGRAISDAELLFVAEKECLGFDHAKIGGMLLRKWLLPHDLDHMVRFHHMPCEADCPAEAAIVHLADILVNALGIGTSGERFVPPIDSEAWKASGMKASIFATATEESTVMIEEMIGILLKSKMRNAS